MLVPWRIVSEFCRECCLVNWLYLGQYCVGVSLLLLLKYGDRRFLGTLVHLVLGFLQGDLVL